MVSIKNKQSIKQLDETVGISKASTHRVFGTRDELMSEIVVKTNESIETVIKSIENENDNFDEWIEKIIFLHFENKEFLNFAGANQICERFGYTEKYIFAMDNFF